MKLGLVAGRHPLPVDRYLLAGEGEVDASPAASPALVAAIQAAVAALPNTSGGEFWGRGPVDLYLTGLTRAALLAVDALRGAGRHVSIWEYDAQTGGYVHTLECPAYPSDVDTGVGYQPVHVPTILAAGGGGSQ